MPHFRTRHADGRVFPVRRSAGAWDHRAPRARGSPASAIRHRLSNSDFAIPEERKYPIYDKGHAKQALDSLASAAPEEKHKVRAAVSRRFPELKEEYPKASPDEKPVPLKSPPKPPFQYFGGKYRIRDKIVNKMPPHRKYVEPFAGAANVLLAKPPAQKEVLADKNPAIIKVHKALKHRPAAWLMDPSRRRWEEVKRKSPSQRTAAEQAFFLDHSFNGMGHTYTAQGKIGKMDTTKLHERMKDVTMVSDDFATVMRRFDSEQTLHYLDPPYVKGGKAYQVHGVTPERVAEVAGRMKGNVIISYDNSSEVRNAFRGRRWHLSTVSNLYTAHQGDHKIKKELIITNFNPSRERASAPTYTP